MQKTVLITGASAGFGLACARLFAARGDKVVAAARRTDKLAALADEFGTSILPLELDVQNRAAVQNAIAALPAPFAAIDVLVNNAGLALGLEPAHKADLDNWDTMIATNCAGLAYVSRAVLPGMVERGRGVVINIGSTAGEIPYAGSTAYGASKAFVLQFTHNLNADLVGSGVSACCIEPGLCGGTEFSRVRFHGDAERAQSVYEGTTPLSSQDIADTVAWVADRPAHVTINSIMMMPNCQSFGGQAVKRRAS
ncbi:SDR family NAD(P)-dependent oxidoreductase [Paludibacterium yongneupense]|uniref:SDR family NAD(P)-dependent oxidoreductase n=1 Tax=Paludibacterium yongneupense TaxID=400061 RepID=UPI00049109FB|nr:SDR family NAD(P)-dependent oxidoreductase [Paludibacterium yongneupense]